MRVDAFQWDLAHLREAAFVKKAGVSSCLTRCVVRWSRCGQQHSAYLKFRAYGKLDKKQPWHATPQTLVNIAANI